MASLLTKFVSLLTPKRRWALFSLGTTFVVVAGLCVWRAMPAGRIVVTGTVLLDGKPVKGATVEFTSPPTPNDMGGSEGSGTTNAYGNFRIKSPTDGSYLADGVYAGDFIITLTTVPELDDETLELPASYAEMETSPLRRTVVAGRPNDLMLELNSRQGGTLADWVGVDAPPPTVEETGGQGSHFYFEFTNGWTTVLDDTILAVIAEPNDRWLLSLVRRAKRYRTNDVFVVSRAGADRIERVLRRYGLFQWKSVPNMHGKLASIGGDGGLFEISVRGPGGTHRVIIGDPYYYWDRPPTDAANPLYTVERLIADVRAIAEAHGEPIDLEDPNGVGNSPDEGE